MTSKEIIKKIIHHDSPPRIGFNFDDGVHKDMTSIRSASFTHPVYDKYKEFGDYPELKERVPSFRGELRMTPDGNIYGRLDQLTKGECIKGALQDGWELFDSYEFPSIDYEADKIIEKRNMKLSDKYVTAGLQFAVFAPLRDVRRIDNALMDVLLEPENVCAYLEKTTDLSAEAIKCAAKNGVDGIMIFDDLGMQHAPFFSKTVFVDIFKPFYRKLADAAHGHGMDFIVHSCGKVTDFIPEFIDAGVDVFQFDQPELHDSEFLAREYGRSAAFYCPVDIQRIMPTGDRKTIEAGALRMVNAFKKYGGSLIVKDYGAWGDIGVLPEWQKWAWDTVIANAMMD